MTRSYGLMQCILTRRLTLIKLGPSLSNRTGLRQVLIGPTGPRPSVYGAPQSCSAASDASLGVREIESKV